MGQYQFTNIPERECPKHSVVYRNNNCYLFALIWNRKKDYTPFVKNKITVLLFFPENIILCWLKMSFVIFFLQNIQSIRKKRIFSYFQEIIIPYYIRIWQNDNRCEDFLENIIHQLSKSQFCLWYFQENIIPHLHKRINFVLFSIKYYTPFIQK